MRAVCLLFLAAGCSFRPGEARPDATADAAVAADAPCAFSSQFDTCALAGGADLVISGNAAYDTTAGKLFDNGAQVSIERMQLAGKEGTVEVVVVHDFHMESGSHLAAAGTYPLAIVAFGAITLDANATLTVARGGAGARRTCTGGAVAGDDHDGGGGGGGGGAFAAIGGKGGDGNSDGSHGNGGAGGAAAPVPMGPLGGCPGAGGGTGDSPGGAGGPGGGAIYLVSPDSITLAGGALIDAGGGGGGAGTVSGGAFINGDAGGGGGGSGGMILLEAPRVRSDGVLAANGGGGGAGSGGSTQGAAGQPGQPGVDRANGGSDGQGTGTTGGSGGALAVEPGDAVTTIDQGGGGGGGGGAGYVIVISADARIAMASPGVR